MRKLSVAVALSALIFSAMSCKTTKEEESSSYIGPSDITLVDGRLSPEGLLSLGRLSDPQLSPDGGSILYGVSYTSIEENRSCRNLYIVGVDGSDPVALTKDSKSISNARFSKDGSRIFFLQGGQVWEAPIMGLGTPSVALGERTCRTDVKAGIGEFHLSPDESMIMYVSTVPSAVKSPKDSDPALDKAQAYVVEDLAYRHWDNWVEEIPHTYVAKFTSEKVTKENSTDILGGDDILYELPLMPYGGLEQLSWSPDSRTIAYSCKKLTGKQYAFSTDTEIYLYDVESGSTGVIPMAGGYDTDPAWSPDGRHLAWISMARNGYEADKTRLMVAEVSSLGGGEFRVEGIRDLTDSFKYNAEGIFWSEDSRSIYFSALAEGIQGIFRTLIDTPSVVRLTDENLWFDFSSPFAVLPDGSLLATYASMEFPTEIVKVVPGNAEPAYTPHTEAFPFDPFTGHRIAKDGYLYADCPVVAGASIQRITHENDHILSQVRPHTTEAHYVKTVDGKDMLTWVLLPPGFDSSRKYPAIEICLGGPQGTLSQGWSYRWNYSLMTNQGYVVVLPNRRGTTAFGPEWTEQISGDYIGLNMQDYMKAGREMKAASYVDKLAACGASYGGYSVYYLAGVHGDLYDCFIAHAGIFDETYMYYETEEMWFPNWDNGGLSEYSYTPGEVGPRGDGVTFGGMKQGGSPWSNLPKAQRHYANSPAARVSSWHTPILCIHGMMDYRIPYDQGMAAFNAAQMMGVPSKLIVFPEECHWILKPQNALFWHRSYFEWLDKWCK